MSSAAINSILCPRHELLIKNPSCFSFRKMAPGGAGLDNPYFLRSPDLDMSWKYRVVMTVFVETGVAPFFLFLLCNKPAVKNSIVSSCVGVLLCWVDECVCACVVHVRVCGLDEERENRMNMLRRVCSFPCLYV